MKKFTYLLFITILITSCGENTSEETDVLEDTLIVEVEKEAEIPQDQKFDDLSQFLAGYNGTDESSLKALEPSDVFKNYQLKINELWKQTDAKLPTIKEWSANELADVNTNGGTLFYPFSGADFLHADLFFPDHDNIVMIALEPIGTFPDLVDKSQDTTFQIYMSKLKKSMNAILGMSFFRTIAMADDFKSELDGTLHVLMHFMARTNHKVLYQEKIAIQPNGELTNDLSSVSDSTCIGNRYYFQRNGEDKVRTLTYFAVNIQNVPYVSRGGLVAKGLETRTDLVAYFKGINIKSTYLKSASYLMHRPTFSIIRNLILNESEYLLQDDSGIPVQYFATNIWNLTFYGNYSKPISLFEERHQEDLKEIYLDKENVKSLPFGIGYQYRKGTSNLMKASKK